MQDIVYVICDAYDGLMDKNKLQQTGSKARENKVHKSFSVQ